MRTRNTSRLAAGEDTRIPAATAAPGPRRVAAMPGPLPPSPGGSGGPGTRTPAARTGAAAGKGSRAALNVPRRGTGPGPDPAADSAPLAGSGSRRRREPLTGLALLASKMPENGGKGSLEHALITMLRDDFPGFLKQHNSDSRRAHSGWPDWVIGGPRGVLYRELKREGKNPTPVQQAWLDALAADGADAGVWRPSDLLSGRIARELAAIAGLGVAT